MPLAIFLVFALAMWWSDQKNILREVALLIFLIPALAIIAFFGGVVMIVGYEPLIIMSAALAQSVPFSFTTFRYSEAKGAIEENNQNYKIDRMEEEIADLKKQIKQLEMARQLRHHHKDI